MDILQPFLYASLILLVLAFTVVVIYVALILREVKEMTKEAKESMQNIRKVTSTIIAPLSSLGGILAGIGKGIKAIRSISDEEEDE